MGFFRGPTIVRDGLVLYLDAANTKSYPTTGTTWFDLSGGGYNGTLTNGPTFITSNKGSLVFDGTDDYVLTNLVLPSPVTTPTTFEVVFKNNSTTTFKGLIGASAYQSAGFSIGLIGQSTIRATYNASGLRYEPQWTYDSSVISYGTFVFDGRSISVYRNGKLISTQTATFDAVSNNNNIRIGSNLQGGWTTAQVNIYSVKIYNKTLNSTEVFENYNATKGRFGL